MNELFRIIGTLSINGISEAQTAFSKMGKVAAKATAAAVTAAATGIATITKAAVESYADYEQLVGGVDTLFKESSEKVQAYADAAYKTAGLTANKYMETVTSFSASLLQSLDGNTEEASEMANKAIIDMADNANKMGSDMESIQAAYQGFAKQNYTLLDNLKLGYGGTATEMARLINDSGVLGDKMIDLTDKQNIGAAVAEVGFAKIVEAIHVVQKEMGISGITAEEAAELVASGAMTQEEAFELMGTTAKEASTTIQGSIASMKGAWGNLLTGLAAGNQDIDLLVKNLGDSIMTTADNLIPRIQITLESIATLIETVVPPIVAKLPEIVMAVLPDLLKAAVKIVISLVENILYALVETISTVLGKGFAFITEKWNQFWAGIKQKCLEIIDSMKQGINTRIENTKKIVQSGFSLIETYIVNPITSAYKTVVGIIGKIKDTVADAISTVKGFFDNDTIDVNTEVTTANGKKVKTRKHAEGGILTRPTIFGYTPSTGTYHLGGEAGAEAVAPIDVLQGYVRDAVAEGSNNAETNGLLQQLIELQKKTLQAMSNTKIELDGREFGRMVKGYAG